MEVCCNIGLFFSADYTQWATPVGPPTVAVLPPHIWVGQGSLNQRVYFSNFPFKNAFPRIFSCAAPHRGRAATRAVVSRAATSVCALWSFTLGSFETLFRNVVMFSLRFFSLKGCLEDFPCEKDICWKWALSLGSRPEKENKNSKRVGG